METDRIAYSRIPVGDIGGLFLSGAPVVIYGYNIVPEITAAAPDFILWSPTDADTKIVHVHTTADVPTTVMFPEGITFPNGAFHDAADALNMIQVTIFYKKII